MQVIRTRPIVQQEEAVQVSGNIEAKRNETYLLGPRYVYTFKRLA